jgi:hypothetical protein
MREKFQEFSELGITENPTSREFCLCLLTPAFVSSDMKAGSWKCISAAVTLHFETKHIILTIYPL